MQTLALTQTEHDLYHAALSATHTIQVDVQVLDLAGQIVKTITDPVASAGQVNIDTAAEVTRSCTLTWRDPDHSLQFDTDSPGTAVYFDNMIRVRVGVRVPALANRLIFCDVFTGPLTKFNRTGDVVSLEAQGKDSRARIGVPTLTYKKGKNAVDAIHDILYNRCGERSFDFPSGRKTRLPDNVTVSWDDGATPWEVCRKIASSLGLQLFYDGRGQCVLRTQPAKPCYTFQDGAGGNIVGEVQVEHSKEELRNQVYVVGKKKQHHWTATLPSNHPASPQRLAVNGVNTYLRVIEQNNHVRSLAGAKRRATRMLADYQKLRFTMTLDAIPVYCLDELDLVTISAANANSTERVHNLSIPIGGGNMTFGYSDLVAVVTAKARKP